jgi:HD-GYP domain-containing protein (c-di-GMP phosphodiesterase class II)
MAMPRRTRLAEALAALSLATDMAAGQPKETAMGTTILATRMARRIGLSNAQIADIYYAAIIRFLGCTSASAEAAALGLGDDQAIYFAFSMADWVDAASLRATAEKWLAPQAPQDAREGAIEVLVDMLGQLPAIETIHCAQAKFMCSQLPVPSGVLQLLTTMYPRWDGKLTGLEHDKSALGSRIIMLAIYSELYRRTGGPGAAIEFMEVRAGSLFDPSLVRLYEREHQDLLAGFDAASLWDLLLEQEPSEPIRLKPDELASVARTFGDTVDQKSAWTLGHSTRVAALAYSAAGICGLSDEEREELRLAALMHDIGRMAISNAVLDKAEPLTAVELSLFKSHSYHTEQILSLIPGFESLARLASSAHECADGSGFHRGVPIGEMAPSLLAAANAYVELTQDRPWREAIDEALASEKMLQRAAAGKLGKRAVNAVLEVAGHGKRRSQEALPAGLTRREIEVLALIAQGRTTKAIAARLAISPKTADHHIQSIYNKTGVRGRAAVSLFALQQGIFAQ